jgi:DtxR family Mn-dependent transcriptional regulator
MTDLIDTTEMYLRTILDLEEEGIVPLRARISERLGHSGPTVSQTIARMERDGLVVVSDDRHLELTDAGRSKAVHVMRKHRLAERLLSDVIGLEWEFVHEEACRWEHVMSEQVERRLIEILGQPRESPYGNPIPGLEELGLPASDKFLTGVVNVVDRVAADGRVTARIRRLAEPVQFEPELLAQLKQYGILPGAMATFSPAGSYVRVDVEGADGGLELPSEVAAHIFVELAATPEPAPTV